MTAIGSTQKISKRSLTFNKSFVLSVALHLLVIFGVTITTYYKLPIFQDSPVINVKFANSNKDMYGSMSSSSDLKTSNDDIIDSAILSKPQDGNFQTFKVKKLEANSVVNSDEAMYLNIWQRKIETIGDKIIQENNKDYQGTVQVMATIDKKGNLIKSDILKSSGNAIIDNMAIQILNESAPFAPFNGAMTNDYSFIEIVRDWNFSSRL
ncbi:MAG: energy transducer TonB [Gammaproteobacteria bacterium]|jgi:protein TonB|nr:TonB family protein [Gammaproteobacteria bacterium]|tara:strand:+ start:2655 stop:3281 length:627 start_codon:yes stop_codon:yes gene_type:complete